MEVVGCRTGNRQGNGRRVAARLLAFALLLGSGLAGRPLPAGAAEPVFAARVRWTPVAGAAGYRVYFRNGSGGWDAGRDVGGGRVDGAALETEVEDLPLGNRNVFTVAAYDLRGREGARSNPRALTREEVLAAGPGSTPTPGNEPTPTPTPSPVPTPTPDPTPTPVPSTCGDGEVGPAESCDGAADDACPGFCSDDCGCRESRDLPLRGWTLAAGDGTFGVYRILDDDGTTPIRVLQTDTGSIPARSFGISYPPTPSLGAAGRILSIVLQATESFSLRVVVRDADGVLRRIVYTTGSFVPTRRGRTVDFPVGRDARSPDFVLVERDVAADLAAATGREFATLEQVSLFGRMSVKRIGISRSPDPSLPRQPGESLVLPSQGWAWNGEGSVDQGVEDPSFDGPTLLSAIDGDALPRLSFPAEESRRLVAPYGRLTALVDGRDAFSLELVLDLADRSAFRIVYDGAAVEEKLVSGREATVPLPVPGADVDPESSRVLVVDPEADLARLRPDATLAGVARVRLRGGFRSGPIVLDRRLDR